LNAETTEIIDAEEVFSPTNALSTIGQEIDIQIASAKRFPRKKDAEIVDKIMSRATLTPSVAEECIYSLKRDTKTIVGPSIRFAEIVRSCYGNIRVASRFSRIDMDDRMRQAVIVEAVAFDVEMNDSVGSQVRRSIMTSAKNGMMPRPYSADMTAVTVMAAQSIAQRNAILSLVPKLLWVDAHYKVIQVIQGSAETLHQRRQKAIEAFSKFEITEKQILISLGYDTVNEIGLSDLPTLIGMWQALRDGEAPESVLGIPIERQQRVGVVKNPMDERPQEPSGESTGKAPRKPRSSGKPPQGASSEPEAGKNDNTTAETRDTAAEAAQEGAEAAASLVAQQQQPAAAPAPKPAEKPVQELTGFEKARNYINDFVGEPEVLIDWWRSAANRAARQNFEFDDSEAISKLYSEKIAKLSN
jgi:hypothetical protein